MDSKIAGHIQSYCACLQEWNASYEEYAKSVGLSYTGLFLLTTLYETENCTQKLLSEKCFLPKQTVNAVVTAFYKKGWLRMQELPEDRRNKTLHFTEVGIAEAERILQRVYKSEQAAMSELSPEEQQCLVSLTRRYVTACRIQMEEL